MAKQVGHAQMDIAFAILLVNPEQLDQAQSLSQRKVLCPFDHACLPHFAAMHCVGTQIRPVAS
jgi:hypothetical protein